MMNELPVFLQRDDLPETTKQRHETVCSSFIPRVVCFVLAPAEANIPQACRMWIERLGIAHKTEMRYGKVPEEYIREALLLEDAVAVFWTCAVFKREYSVFFENTNTLPFFFEQVMRLDEMQLAARSRNVHAERGATIASHVSPAPLVQSLERYGCSIVDANSNGIAAQMCVAGEVDMCITTESARKKYELETLHSFGSPEMVFFGGITEAGADMIASAYAHMHHVSAAV